MKEEISALMDGELNPDAAADVIAQLYKTDGLRDEWIVYHLISDALGQPGVMPTAITRRVSARLATEPTALAPRPPIRHKPGVFAAAASVAAVAVIGWMSLQTTDRREENPASNNLASTATNTAANTVTDTAVLQTAPAVVSVSASAPAFAQIDDYLLAHGQFSPGAAVHGVAPYMYTVAESRENAAR